MRPKFFARARPWPFVLVLVLAFTVWVDGRRIQRIEHIATLTRGESVPHALSATGYAGGVRERVLPDHDGRSYEWLAKAQTSLANGTWRIRRLPDENAPFGRAAHESSLYHGWVAAVARVHHAFSPVPTGISVEHAASYVNPLLHLLIVIGVTAFAARYFGSLAASLVALAGTFLFPFASRFLPGEVDESALQVLCAVGSLLPLMVGVQRLAAGPKSENVIPHSATPWFIAAGIFGGIGFWLSPWVQGVIALGIGLGTLLCAWVWRAGSEPLVVASEDGHRNGRPQGTPLQLWSISGAITILAAYFVEYFPAHLGDGEFRAIHPLYGLSWIGGGELLSVALGWIQYRAISWRPRDVVLRSLAFLCWLAVPIVIYRQGVHAFVPLDTLAFRLTTLPTAVMAPSVATWIRLEGFTAVTWTTLLPLLLLVPALILLLRKTTAVALRASIAVMVGPVLLLLVFASLQLRQWLILDLALALLILPVSSAVVATGVRRWRWFWSGAVALVLLPGAFLLVPPLASVRGNVLSVSEAVGLVERDLAHALAKRSEGSPPLVLAPPALTKTLVYYGGLRGIGTLSWENQDGLLFAIRVAISASRTETAALLRARGVNYVIVPSWDPFFDSYLQAASVQVGELFYTGLKRWNLPLWLRPIPYQLPAIPGFEQQSVKIFEVVDDQEPSVAASRMTEYFIEMAQFDQARASVSALLKYPADFGALVARAELWAALRDVNEFAAVFEPLLSRLAAGGDRYLPWDRRVSLAFVLAQGDRMDLARGQLERCLANVTEVQLRLLTSQALYRFLALNKSLGLSIANPQLQAWAVRALPESQRTGL